MNVNIPLASCYNVASIRRVLDMNVNIPPTPCYNVAYMMFEMNVNLPMEKFDDSAVAQGAPSPKNIYVHCTA